MTTHDQVPDAHAAHAAAWIMGRRDGRHGLDHWGWLCPPAARAAYDDGYRQGATR